MRMLNHDTDTRIDNLILLLTSQEAKELSAALSRLLATPDQPAHAHVLSDDPGQAPKEIALALYHAGQVEGLPARYQQLILTDK